MVGDGDFPKKSRKVPPADSTRNFFQEEVVGNKTDAAVTSPTTTKTLMAYAKGTLNQLSSIITLMGQVIDVHQNVVSWSDVNRSVRFEISLIDKDSGGIATGSITAGTYTIQRNRHKDISAFADAGAGVVTVTSNTHGLLDGNTVQITGTTNYNGSYTISGVTAHTFNITVTWVATETGLWNAWQSIVTATAFSKATGLVYTDYFFTTTSWATDDIYRVTPTGISVVIGGNTYYPAVTSWVGTIQDTSTIEGKIDVIDTNVDTALLEVSEAQSEIASCALEQSTVLSQIESSADLIYPNNSSASSTMSSHVLEQSTILSQIESSTDTLVGGNSDIQSEVASHALEQSTTLSGLQSKVVSCASEQNINESETQSELASHVVGLSEIDSELQSKLVSHALAMNTGISRIESSTDGQITLESQTQSEIASHVTQRSTNDSEMQSKIVSHALEVGTGLSQISSSTDTIVETASRVESSLEGGLYSDVASAIDVAHAESISTIASHALQNSVIDSEVASAVKERDIDLSTVQSSADLIEPGFTETQSEIASHVVAESEARSELQSKLVSHAVTMDTGISQIESSMDGHSTTLSEAVSALAERDTDLSDLQSSADSGYDNVTSLIASHALANGTDLSQVESSTDGLEAEHDVTQSELASHVLANSESDSELLSHVSAQATEEGVTQSELASHVAAQSESLSEMQSKIVSCALENSTGISTIRSSLEAT